MRTAGYDTPAMRLFPLLLLLTGCKNECIHMCQRMDKWLNECGYSWDAKFQDRGWESIDDCYDDQWDVSEKTERSCAHKAQKWDRKSCY